jgi:hypothetical protein
MGFEQVFVILSEQKSNFQIIATMGYPEKLPFFEEKL